MSIRALMTKCERDIRKIYSSIGWCVGRSLFDLETDLCDISDFLNDPMYRGINDPEALRPHYFMDLLIEYFENHKFHEIKFQTPPWKGVKMP